MGSDEFPLANVAVALIREEAKLATIAERILVDELGVPRGIAQMRPASSQPITYHDRSETAETPTFYVHRVFFANLADETSLKSQSELVWAPLTELLGGQARLLQSPLGAGGRDQDFSHNPAYSCGDRG
jgi:hypothetical protein